MDTDNMMRKIRISKQIPNDTKFRRGNFQLRQGAELNSASPISLGTSFVLRI